MTYKIQIDDKVRNATANEIEQIETLQADEKAQVQAQAAKAEAKANALTKLGLTADEAAALFG
jgi:hypothetical protein